MPTRPFATSIVKRLISAGHTAYFAGGWVRDLLMNRPSDDIDIATSASVGEVQRLFPKTIPVGVAFGIVIVVEEGHQFEVATFRKDLGYVDGRRPTGIDPADPKEDAKRRDFTINGMFYDPLQERIYDFVGGKADIEKKIIRAIGDPHERFLEDRLRMMRAVRYATRFDFSIETATYQAILDHAKTLLPAVAIERVWQEFKKMSRFAHFDTGLISLHKLDLLPTIFPDLKGVSVEKIVDRLAPLKNYPPQTPAIAELIPLFPDYCLEKLHTLCDYLKLSKEEKDFLCFLHHAKELLSMPADWLKNLEKIEWAQFYAHPDALVSIQIFSAHLPNSYRPSYLQEHAERAKSLQNAIDRIRSKQPVIRSEHLLKEGILPGKKMGQLLKEGERISVNSHIEDPSQVICLLKKSSLWHN
ncbi:MAG: CCA tRNA nucleotidyltransferase [Chlamydiales bacterium]|nr:CCA tRNA nucleotidyltransferase [Chlamydiales bacterium]